MIRCGDEDTLAAHLHQGQLDAPVEQAISRGMRVASADGDFDLVTVPDDDRDGVEHCVVLGARLLR